MERFIPLITPTSNKRRKEVFGIFGKAAKKSQESFLMDSYLQKKALYKRTQYFLESIYKKLYFICLNYEEAEIQIYHIMHFMIWDRASEEGW